MHQRDLYIIVDDDSGQGVSYRKSGAHTTVCEHFEKGYNTAMVHQMHHIKGSSGVTLIELIVAMGILTILVSGILPLSYMTYKRSKEIELRQNLRVIRNAIDDYKKMVKRNSVGLKAKYKMSSQIFIGTLVGIFLYSYPYFNTHVSIPFFKGINPDLGWFFIPFVVFIIVGTSNAVNLTDGLDGLAIGPVTIAGATYLLFSYLAGHVKIADYLQISYVAGSGELAVFCGAMLGASMGFLWYNTYPAQIFMGDVGSLALGGALGTVAVIIKQEVVLVIVGGIFVIETLSVIFQVGSYKLRRKRIFRMAPIHHHFELKGWAEPKIIVRFWIIAIILALVAISTLKLR